MSLVLPVLQVVGILAGGVEADVKVDRCLALGDGLQPLAELFVDKNGIRMG